MKRLQKLTDLTNYLTALRVPGVENPPIRVVDQSQATNRLSFCKGVRVLIARPEIQQNGNEDTYDTTYSTCIFVLEKNLGAGSTEERDDEQFLRLSKIACELLTQIERDAGNWNIPEMRDISLESMSLIPESSIFGGWNGYSIELTFK